MAEMSERLLRALETYCAHEISQIIKDRRQEDFEVLEEVSKVRVKYYNRIRRHSTLENKSPFEYLNRKSKNKVDLDC